MAGCAALSGRRIARLEQDLTREALPDFVQAEIHPDFATPTNRVTLAQSPTPELDGEAALVPMFDAPHRIPICPQGLLIGSSPDADVCIVDGDEIAKEHAAIYAKSTGYVLREVDGPVWVNGERLGERRLLGGETVRLSGWVSFVFKWVRPIG